MSSKTEDVFDVLVVGSGASGGWAAKRLAEAGVKVALVDAGRPQSLTSFTEHELAFKLPYRDRAPELVRRTRPAQKDCYACMEWNYDWFCNDLEEPYTTRRRTSRSAGRAACASPAAAPTSGAGRATA